MLGQHTDACRCHECFTSALGAWVDELGSKTSLGTWQVFGTLTYATRNYPWQRGFPINGSGRPHPDFAHNLFSAFTSHLEAEIGHYIDYVVADQFGSIGGRFHQHCLLSAPGLDKYSRNAIWQWLHDRAGWSRILPSEKGAAYYISRYIGRDADKCDWNFRIGEMSRPLEIEKQALGRVVLVHSAPVEKALLHTGFKKRKR